MNMIKIVTLIIVILLLWQEAFAQAKPKPEVLSEKMMNAEFRSIDESAPVRLTDYRHKIIVLALWASWCGPCRFVVADLNKFNKEFVYRNVEVLGLSTDDPKADAESTRSLVKELELEYKLGWIDNEMRKELVGRRNSIPQIFVITDEGVIVKRFIGWSPNRTPSELRNAVEQAIVNPPKK